MSDFRHLCNFFSSQYASIVSSKKIPNAPKLGHLRSSSLMGEDFSCSKAKGEGNTCVFPRLLTMLQGKYAPLNLVRFDYRYLKEVCLEMYPRCQSLSGLFGSNPYLLGSFYKRRNIPYRMTFSYRDFFDSLDNVKVAVISFWCKNKPFGGLHTVAVEKVDGYKIKVYNRYNNRDYPYIYKSRRDFLPKKSDFICGYLIEEGKNHG